jgi:peptidyl-prolyl cis-trans isomerase D
LATLLTSESLIQQRVIDNYLAEAGYQVSDEIITRLIQQTPDFQTDGKFDIELYRSILAQNGYDPSDFERAQRVALRRNQLQRAIRGSAVLSPAAYRRYLNLAGEQRVVALANLGPEAVADEIDITEEIIAEYYDANPTLFQLPESADVQYVEIQRSDVAASVEVTEEELRAYYDDNKDLYQQDEQRQARHILIEFGDDEDAAEERAVGLAARARAGEPFEDLARSNSDDPGTSGQGGDLGMRTRSQLPGDLGSTIFAMDEGAIEGPVKTEFGFHVVRLYEILEPGPLPFDQVRAELMSVVQDNQAQDLFRELERDLSDAHFEADTVAELAAAIDVEVKTATGFTRSGGEPLGNDSRIIEAVFDELMLAGGQMSEIVEIDGDRTVVVQVTSYNPATRQPLDAVRDQVISNLRSQQSEQLMAARADKMIAALESGAEFAEAAGAIGASAGEPVLMSRNEQDADQFVSVAVFTAAKPSEESPTIGSTRNGEGGYSVYSVEAVLPGRPEIVPVDQRDAGKLQLTDQTGVSDFVAFVQALREDAEVIINEDAVASSDML